MLSKEIEKEVIQYLKQVRLLLFLEKSQTETEEVMSVVDKMPDLEEKVIRRKYLHQESEYTFHQVIYTDMNISVHTYAKVRLRGLYKIALVLGFVDISLVKPTLFNSRLSDQREENLKKGDFLSKQDEELMIRYLQRAQICKTIGSGHEELKELQEALNKLDSIGANIITRKYLSREAEYTRHQAVYEALSINAVTYKKHRIQALTKLAAELGLMHCTGEN
ncbi:hypothetical protein PSTEL_13170 [Paenibacillus stellifer]|uniref:Uncharacterized protein n=1 Tax=Paenibacillus stellifer TaxID=169760 RepID=A0A089LQV5_9BACL|nr:hypothetical protein [Paenibacillus stellifer]AIQ63891.1 hypothetical protein PSTEL_13170 [Paenibacillus stellifer]